MPRFYFDVMDHSRSPDVEGTELRNMIDARLEAVKFAGVHLSHDPVSSGTATSSASSSSTSSARC